MLHDVMQSAESVILRVCACKLNFDTQHIGIEYLYTSYKTADDVNPNAQKFTGTGIYAYFVGTTQYTLHYISITTFFNHS